ncbi:N-acetyltransferase family protein [Rossellomorea sp. NS-SX7]|uniref:N-acetyltransferase family protein n=1 Tax=Rossellomorea sp. NS-SX7 TaxID=3463856 RepID=UPI004058C299
MSVIFGRANEEEIHEIYELAGINREEATGIPFENHKEEMIKAYEHSKKFGAYFLAARSSGKLLGWVQVDKSTDWVTGKEIGWINDVYVKKSFRGNGVATALLKQALKELKEMEYDEVRLNVYSSNEQAIKLYEKLGFMDLNKFMKLDL